MTRRSRRILSTFEEYLRKRGRRIATNNLQTSKNTPLSLGMITPEFTVTRRKVISAWCLTNYSPDPKYMSLHSRSGEGGRRVSSRPAMLCPARRGRSWFAKCIDLEVASRGRLPRGRQGVAKEAVTLYLEVAVKDCNCHRLRPCFAKSPCLGARRMGESSDFHCRAPRWQDDCFSRRLADIDNGPAATAVKRWAENSPPLNTPPVLPIFSSPPGLAAFYVWLPLRWSIVSRRVSARPSKEASPEIQRRAPGVEYVRAHEQPMNFHSLPM